MATAKNANTPRKQSLGEYLKGVKKEMGKVVWPTRKELGAYTVVVAATCAVCALGFWLVDLGVLALLKNILGVTMNKLSKKVQNVRFRKKHTFTFRGRRP